VVKVRATSTAVGQPPPAGAASGPARQDGFELMRERRPPGLLRRLLTTWRHGLGLLLGALDAGVRATPAAQRHGLRWLIRRALALLLRPFLSRRLRDLPFPVQFRRRLETLGATYIKLGQVLSLRRDLLPPEVTAELGNLLDRLPVVPFERFQELVAEGLGRPVASMFSWIDREPLGSASIAQIHRATTLDGEQVILKVVKPGIAETLHRDAALLRTLGGLLQLAFPRYQPRRMLRELVDFTLKEVELDREADNAETFARNFADQPDIVFPRVYRRLSSRTVLCQQFLSGPKPNDPEVRELPAADRQRLISLGTGAIIQMLYQDGFFHADLHPGNLVVLPGPRCGFIDLGTVGRFSADLRRDLFLYYYFLVAGDAATAARYLLATATTGPGSDEAGFRREVEEISQRFGNGNGFGDYSLAQLILVSISRGARYRIYYPVELVLMVKALVTFEGVGALLQPDFDAAHESRVHLQRLMLQQLSPLKLMRDTIEGGPQFVDALLKTPTLLHEGLRMLEENRRRPKPDPMRGLQGTIFGGFCLVAGAVLASQALWWPAGALGLVGLVLALRRN
jgi:ubiquinone biosynthesis protein